MKGNTHLKLLDDEKLFIETKPIRKIYARKGWPLALAGIPLLLISAYLIYKAFHISRSLKGPEMVKWVLILLGVPFLLVGLFLTAGQYLLFYFEAPSVRYTITSRRIIIRRGFIIHKEFEIFVDGIVGLKVIKGGGPENAGTIKFIGSGKDSGTPFYMKRFPTEKFRGDVQYAIEAVPDVDSVRFLIQKAIDQRKRGNAFSY